MSERATDSDVQPVLGPFKVRLGYMPVSMGRDDRLDDLILRFGGEVEEGLEVDRGPVFTEDEGRRGVRNAHLVWVQWVVIGALRC